MNNFDFQEISVLDLFSGTGNISYEFASRGCRKIIAVDNNYPATRFIQKASSDFGFTSISIIRMDVIRYLERTSENFDLIFADPPYEMKDIEKIPELIFKRKLINVNGWLILEHSGKVYFSDHKSFLEERKYGYVHFSIFQQ